MLGENNELSNREMNVDYGNVKQVITNNELTESEVKIIELFNENGKITLEEVSVKLGRSLRTVKSIVKSLIEKKKVERVGSKKDIYWKVL